MLARSRSSCRFWASRISGAAYAAWVEKAKLSRMNGYGSQCRTRPTVLSTIQTSTITVCQNRNRPVPRNRAIASENRPNASASYRAPIWGEPRGTDRSARSLSRRSDSRAMSASRPAPARGQQVVQYVVYGDRADQPPVVVADRHADQVVGSQPGSQLVLGQLGPDEQAPVLDDVADQGGRRSAQQPLEAHAAQEAPGRRDHGRLAHVHLRGGGDRHLRVPDPGQNLGDRRVRGEDERMG